MTVSQQILSNQRLVVITDVPPRRHAARGWAGRHYSILKALAEAFDMHVIFLRRALHEGQVAEWAHIWNGRPRVWEVPVPDTNLSRAGIRGRVGRLKHYISGPIPVAALTRGGRSGSLRTLIEQLEPRVVVIFMPWLAHHSLALPAAARLILVLEEAWERVIQVTTADLPLIRRVLARESEIRRWDQLYRLAGDRADTVVVLSDLEAENFKRVVAREKLRIVPHGVDNSYFQKSVPRVVIPPIDVLLIGHMSINRNAALSARVYAAMADSPGSAGMRWAVVGGRPGPALERLRGPNFILVGQVEDVRPFYAVSKVLLAAAESGSGSKNTVLEAWATGTVVVATPLALAGLPAVHGRNALIGHSPAELAELVRRALSEEELYDELRRQGLHAARQLDSRRIAADFVAQVMSVWRGEPGGIG